MLLALKKESNASGRQHPITASCPVCPHSQTVYLRAPWSAHSFPHRLSPWLIQIIQSLLSNTGGLSSVVSCLSFQPIWPSPNDSPLHASPHPIPGLTSKSAIALRPTQSSHRSPLQSLTPLQPELWTKVPLFMLWGFQGTGGSFCSESHWLLQGGPTLGYSSLGVQSEDPPSGLLSHPGTREALSYNPPAGLFPILTSGGAARGPPAGLSLNTGDVVRDSLLGCCSGPKRTGFNFAAIGAILRSMPQGNKVKMQ